MKHILKSGEQFIVDGYTSEGEHKVLNLLDTNTDDIATLKVVSHTKLQFLKNTQQLSPGTFYRVIDYNCTTTQENTSVGPGQFDIVIQALSESELSEKGRCIRHSEDSYFSNCKVESWEINYSLDNNKSKYSWVDDEVIAICCDDGDDVNSWYKRRPELDESKNGTQYYAWDCIWNSEEDDYWMLRDVDRDDTFNIDSENNYRNDCIYTMVDNPKQGQSIQQYYKSGSNFYSNGNYSYHIIQKGHGVIYWMKDEFGNECPYDFKHLRFLDTKYEKYAWTFNEPYIPASGGDFLSTTEVTKAKIWVDHFWFEGNWANDQYSQSEIAADYTLNKRGKVYDYTGNYVTYDGNTLYIWRLSSTGTENEFYDGVGYAFTTNLDYSGTTINDKVAVYAFGSSEDTGNFLYELGESSADNNQYIYHATFSDGESAVDLSSIVNDLSQVSATIMIDNFVDAEGNWGECEEYPTEESLADITDDYYDTYGDFHFTGNCIQYDGKILFVWYNDNIDGIIFTTGLDYSSYSAVDQVCPIYAIANSEGAVMYDQDHDHNIAENLRSIIIYATYSGPDIPKGNLLDTKDIEQNLSGTIQNNKISSKFENGRIQVLDLTQIYYGPRNGSPYTKDEIDEAHEVVAFALNEQKEILDKTIPFPEIIEVEHVSGSVIQELDPWKYYIFGEVSSLEVSFSEEVSEYTPIYRFLFTAAGSDTQLILPQNCSLASGHSLVMVEGKSYEIEIINNIVRVISATLE